MNRRRNIWRNNNTDSQNAKSNTPKQQHNGKDNQTNQKTVNGTSKPFKTLEELQLEMEQKLQSTRQQIADSYQRQSTIEQNTNNNPQDFNEVGDQEEESEELTTADLIAQLKSGKRQGQPKHIPRSQRRGRFCLSVSVSEEDELVFRAAAVAADMGFSEWARKAMYKYAKVKPSKRFKK